MKNKMLERPRIIDVTRKPAKCPVCGEHVVDIIYGTGDMTEADFLMEYRQNGYMGGDNIPRRPPIWACSCGCKRFRKVNPDGTDVSVKVKLLKGVRKKPLSLISWTTEMASINIGSNQMMLVHNFEVAIVTDFGEKEKLRITAVNVEDAEDLARKLVSSENIGLKGRQCVSLEVYDE